MKTRIIAIALTTVALLSSALLLCSCSPALSNEDVLKAVGVEDAAATMQVQSDWASDAPFEFTSAEVEEQKNNQTNGEQKLFRITATYENDYFVIVECLDADFTLQDGKWVLVNVQEISHTGVPNGNIDADVASSKAMRFMNIVDEKHPVEINEKKVKLADLYKENFNASTTEVSVQGSEATVVLSISSKSGFASYSGTLTAYLTWNGSDWVVTDCIADDAAYKGDYSSLIGTWQGEWQEIKGGYGEKYHCYGANEQPLTITFKEIDSSSMTAKVDIGFLVHDHKDPENVVSSTEGDRFETVTDVLIPLDFDKRSKYRAYTLNGANYNKWEINLCFSGGSDEGIISAEVENWVNHVYHDTFILKKVEQ